MPSEYKNKPSSKSDSAEVDSSTPVTVDTSDVDDLLDEIDSVLEENAEQFVNEYRQKGGQ